MNSDLSTHENGKKRLVRRISITMRTRVILPFLRPYVDRVVAAVNAATPWSYCEVEIPEG